MISEKRGGAKENRLERRGGGGGGGLDDDAYVRSESALPYALR